MPLVLIFLGVVFLFVGLKGDATKLYGLVVGDFSGPNNFVYWLVVMFFLGSLGYIQSLKNLSRLFIALVVIVLFLDNKGFFAQFQAFLKSTENAGVQK